jgi:competence protein ComEC
MSRWKSPFREDEKGIKVDERLAPDRPAGHDLLPSSGLLPSMARRFVPAFLRHGAWHLAHRTRQAIQYESETGAKFLALPVAFAIGALFYFALPREPMLLALMLALVVFSAISIKTYGRVSGNIALVVVFVLGGMTAGKLRSNVLDTRMIERPVQAKITGVVLNR